MDTESNLALTSNPRYTLGNTRAAPLPVRVTCIKGAFFFGPEKHPRWQHAACPQEASA